MFAPLQQNAFRILALPASASLEEVYKRQRQLEISLEMEEDLPGMFSDTSKLAVTREALYAAVHRLEDESFRVREEAYWFLSPLSAVASSTSQLIPRLQAAATGNSEEASLAKHDLAVVTLLLGTEHAMEPNPWVRCQHATRSLAMWESLCKDETFWIAWERQCASTDRLNATDMVAVRKSIPAEITGMFAGQAAECLSREDHELAKQYCMVVKNCTSWVPAASTQLERLGKGVTKDGNDGLQSLVDSLDDTATADQLKQCKAKVVSLDARTQTKLASTCASSAVRSDWGDSVARAYRRLAIQLFNEHNEQIAALELNEAALQRVTDGDLRKQLIEDQHWLFYQIAYGQALKLIDQGQFQRSIPCLERALQFAPDDKKEELRNAIANFQGRRDEFPTRQASSEPAVLPPKQGAKEELDRSQRSPTLQTVNGIGLTFYGKRNSDPASSTYITTHWFTVLFVPLLAVGAYRVRDSGPNSYLIYGRTKISKAAKIYNWCVAAVIAVWIIAASVSDNGRTYRSSANSLATEQRSSSSTGAGDTDAPSSTSVRTGSSNATNSLFSDLGTSVSSDHDAIERERTRLESLRSELKRRAEEVEQSKTQLDIAESNLNTYKVLYPNGIPEPEWTQYQIERDDYNAEVRRHNASVAALKRDAAEFDRAIDVFNQRVREYNRR